MAEARKYVLAYLSGRIDLEDLNLWVWDVASSDEALETLVEDVEFFGNVELKLAELTGGHISEDRFREALSEALPSTLIVMPARQQAAPELRTGTSRRELLRLELRSAFA